MAISYSALLAGLLHPGRFYEEALTNIEDAIRLHIEDRRTSGEPIPTAEMVRFYTRKC